MSITARSLTKAEAVLEKIKEHLAQEQRVYFDRESTLFDVGLYQHSKQLTDYIKHWENTA